VVHQIPRDHRLRTTMSDQEFLKVIADNLSAHLTGLEKLREKYVLPASRQSPSYADEHIASNREAIVTMIGAVHHLINHIAEKEGLAPIVDNPKLISK
jgi:hypothetical protein